jgi:hypothetical protein
VAASLDLEVLLLPLAQPHEQGIIGTDCGAGCSHDFGSEAGTFLQRRAAIAVVALVGGVPEELVDQIAMRTMDLDHVKAKPLCIRCGLGKGGYGVGNVFIAHGNAVRVAGGVEA